MVYGFLSQEFLNVTWIYSPEKTTEHTGARALDNTDTCTHSHSALPALTQMHIFLHSLARAPSHNTPVTASQQRQFCTVKAPIQKENINHMEGMAEGKFLSK